MAERWFLKPEGIVGESTDATHAGEIDVLGWSWELNQVGSTSSGGGGGAGKVSFQDFHFTTRVSKASPALFLTSATGKHLKEAILTGVRAAAKGKGSNLLVFRLRDVLVTGYSQSDGEGDAPAEQFSLSFSSVEMSYFVQSATGKPEPPITAGYDLKANKKI